MDVPDASCGTATALEWKIYRVRPRDKRPLLNFLLDGLKDRGCRILVAPEPNRAPFYIVFETPAGERHALLAYAFYASARDTNRRPDDEHRFQVKYGSQLKGVLEVAVDPEAVITTIFLGIDPARDIFVAADPLMNAPSPMSRSIEFKAAAVDKIKARGWYAWERAMREPKTRTRPTPEIDEDTRVQILVGGTRDRIFDLVVLERLALGLDPGERHLLAEKLGTRRSGRRIEAASHQLLKELDLEPEALFDLIEGAGRLKMAVRGWVAEEHLENALRQVPGVTDCRRLNAEGQPDISLRWRGGEPLLVECKNVLRRRDRTGTPRVDFQKTRASIADRCSRYYAASDFPVLAACLHAVSELWEFKYALTSDLPRHEKCPGRISNKVVVDEPMFTSDPAVVFERQLP